jgi:TM2 domain-containing membrane protein YozV
VAQGLAITTLELTIVGFIFCSLATSICWWFKPNDVEIFQVFELSDSIDDVLKQAGEDASEVYRNTPLDFASHEEWIGYNLWIYYVNILRLIGLFPDKHKDRLIQRLSSFNFPRPQPQMSELVVLWLGLAYAATFFGAWKFYFPSRLECVLWRVFSVSQCSLCLIVGIFEIYNFATPSTTGRPTTLTGQDFNIDAEGGHTEKPRAVNSFRRFWSTPFNNSVGRHSSLDVPLRSLLVTTPLCAAYCICRWYLLLEDVIGLRSIPSSAYLTVDWTRYWPSF